MKRSEDRTHARGWFGAIAGQVVAGERRFGRALALLGLVVSPAAARAQLPRADAALGDDARLARAVRIERAPIIDGVLDEAFWRDIAPITEFVQREPTDGGVPTERTEVRIAYDDAALYFGLVLHDSEPAAIRRSIFHREGRIDQDDRVVIALDTYHDGRNAYVFELNSFGTQGDALFADEQLTLADWNWEGVYRSEGRVTEDGWALEVAIPFTTIRFAKTDAPMMGIALYRSIRRKNEEVFWPHIGQRYRAGIAQVSQYGTLVGLEGIERGRYIQVEPFAIAGAQKFAGDAESEFVNDIGLDVKYSITSNLTLDLTLNTDFAQVEADNVQINLTRFNLFYPEKRPFFLERAGLFEFGDTQENEVFFSRRIGIVNEILGGGRLTGQVGRVSFGLLNLQTEAADQVVGGTAVETPGANNAVVRVRGDVLPRTSVGGIFTNLQNAALEERSYGADATVRFWGSSALSAWIADTRSALDRSGGTGAGAVALSLRPTSLWSVEGAYTSIGEAFSPALGFVRRTDMVRYGGGASLTPRFRSAWARQLILSGRTTYIDGQDGRKQSTEALLHSMLVFQTGDNVGVTATRETEVLDVPFEIRDGVIIPTGEYTFDALSASARTNESRTFSGNVNLSLGEFFSGTRTQYGGRLTWKTGPHLTLAGVVTRNEISLPVAGGDFDTNVVSLDVLGAVSRDLFANALVQYDDQSETVQANVRIDWIHTPGSDLFIVLDTGYNVAGDFDPRATRWTRRAGVVKLTYLKSF
jgi:hypothetical protein